MFSLRAAAKFTSWQLTNRTLPWENPKARQIANPERFPHGMKALADYLHNKDLKFGLYTARCRFTCQLFAASFSHEAIDAQQWAEWGVDYVSDLQAEAPPIHPTHDCISLSLLRRQT